MDNNIYDEDKAVKYIRTGLSPEISARYSDDDILYLIDIIWDYYEKKGMLSLDNLDSEDELLDEADLISYVKNEVARDSELNVDTKDIPSIVKGELEYEKSLDDIF